MNTELQQLLRATPADRLADIVLSLYGLDREVDNRIESQLLRGNPAALAKHLKKRIQSVKRGQRFVHYGESFSFGHGLAALVEDIESLGVLDPKIAFELADQFMATHRSVFERADDSGGAIGDSYRECVRLWLSAATGWRHSAEAGCRIDWPNELHVRHHDNGYGVWDALISGSAKLLTEAELRQLAWRFEGEVRRGNKERKEDSFDRKAFVAALGMAAVAEALRDVSLYERSMLLRSPELNEQQKRRIVEFCLSVNDGEAALRWLEGSWVKSFEVDRLRLLDKALQLLGRTDELIALRRQAYESDPGMHRLQALLEVLPEAEKAQLWGGAAEKALHATNLETSIDTLIALEAQELAANKVLDHADALNRVYYGTLADWAKVFAQSGHSLAAVVCYRSLLQEILNAGRSKAYAHAARYYNRLVELDARISSYHPFASRADYEAVLRQQHGRKSAFWRLVG